MRGHQPERRESDDDFVEELPPIDGDDAETSEPSSDRASWELGPLPPGAERADDHQAVEDLSIGQLVEVFPDAPPEEDEAGEVQIGDSLVLFSDQGGAPRDDAQGIDNEDLSLGIDQIPEYGLEGPAGDGIGEPIENEIDEGAYPEMDSDDADDLPGALELEQLAVPEDAAMPAWAELRWERVDTPLIAVPMVSVEVVGNEVAAVGDGAVVVSTQDDGGLDCAWLALRGGLPIDPIGIVIGERSQILLATRRDLFISADGGSTATRVGLELPSNSGLRSIRQCRSRPHAICADTPNGHLLASLDGGRRWTRVEDAGAVHAIATNELGRPHVLAKGRDGCWRILRSSDLVAWDTVRVDEGSSQLPRDSKVMLAVRRGTIAIADALGRVHVSWDGGTQWTDSAVPSEPCAIAIVEQDSTPLVIVAVFAESEDRTYLVRLDRSHGTSRVADLSPDVSAPSSTTNGDEGGGLGQASEIAWDAGRGWLWVAGRFGLQAWRPRYRT